MATVRLFGPDSGPLIPDKKEFRRRVHEKSIEPSIKSLEEYPKRIFSDCQTSQINALSSQWFENKENKLLRKILRNREISN